MLLPNGNTLVTLRDAADYITPPVAYYPECKFCDRPLPYHKTAPTMQGPGLASGVLRPRTWSNCRIRSPPIRARSAQGNAGFKIGIGACCLLAPC